MTNKTCFQINYLRNLNRAALPEIIIITVMSELRKKSFCWSFICQVFCLKNDRLVSKGS